MSDPPQVHLASDHAGQPLAAENASAAPINQPLVGSSEKNPIEDSKPVVGKEDEKKRVYKDFGHDTAATTHALVDMSTVRPLSHYLLFDSVFADTCPQIELKAEDLYDHDKVNLETIVVDDVYALLQSVLRSLKGVISLVFVGVPRQV